MKTLGLNFVSIKSLVNNLKGSLIVDFVIIPAYGNEFLYPYNPIYNYNTNKYQNCLVIMFICFYSECRIYPINFEYWLSEVYYSENEKYLTKTDIFINSINNLFEQGLLIENIIFDAGFFNKKVLDKLSKFNIVTRCPKSRLVELNRSKIKAKEIFSNSYNGDFYYYHKYLSFIISENVKVSNHLGKLVGIANSKTKLIDKDLFYLFTNNINFTSAKVLNLYKSRWKIESFFKILKSYLSLSVFYRNDYNYVNQRINLALAAFFIIDYISRTIKLNFYQTLKSFQKQKYHYLFEQAFQNTSKYFYTYV